MKKKLLNNLGLKLFSLVIAVVLWFVVVIMDNPKDSTSFSNIQVTLINTELLEEGNKVYKILDNTDHVRVTVEAPRNVINQIRVSDIVAEADVSKLTEVNTIAINCSVLNESVEILGITANPEVVRLSVEEKAQKWIPVQCKPEGEVAEGYMVDEVKPDQNRIEISGPKSEVDRVKYAQLNIDVSGATSNLSASVPIQLYDAEQKLLEESEVSGIIKNDRNMRVEAQVLAIKEVPLELTPTGIPAEGYVATGVVDFDPPTVLIAGTVYNLSNVSSITVPGTELDITDAEENVTGSINVRRYLPENIKFADAGFNGRVSVTAYVEPIMERTLSVPVTNITVRNLPEGFSWEFPEDAEYCRVRVSGLEQDIAEIDPTTVQGTVDVREWMDRNNIRTLNPGEREMSVSFVFPDNISVGGANVRITIIEVEED